MNLRQIATSSATETQSEQRSWLTSLQLPIDSSILGNIGQDLEIGPTDDDEPTVEDETPIGNEHSTESSDMSPGRSRISEPTVGSWRA
jgi:hypothetical protein